MPRIARDADAPLGAHGTADRPHRKRRDALRAGDRSARVLACRHRDARAGSPFQRTRSMGLSPAHGAASACGTISVARRNGLRAGSLERSTYLAVFPAETGGTAPGAAFVGFSIVPRVVRL